MAKRWANPDLAVDSHERAAMVVVGKCVEGDQADPLSGARSTGAGS